MSTVRYTAELLDPWSGEPVVVVADDPAELERLVDAAFGVVTDPVGRELGITDAG